MDSLKQSTDDEKTHKKILNTKTWLRDSHGLFDYETQAIHSSPIDNLTNGYLYRNNIKHTVTFSDKKDNSSNQFLGTIKIQGGHIYLDNKVGNNLPINNKTLTDLQEKIWYVVNQNNLNKVKPGRYISKYKYELKKNDIIKLGRIKFMVKDLNIVGQEINKSEETFIPYETNHNIFTTKDEICRVCYFANSTEDNPMINVCKCKGSMNLHFQCLKMWLESKLSIQNIKDIGVSYTIDKFNCEICHEPYPFTIKNNDKYLDLLNYTIPEGQNYVILQSLNSIKENAYPLSIHVLMFIENESSFIMGRSHESDIHISDISVSRSHARILMKNNKFYMEDLTSKFGTLILAKEPVDLASELLFQVGRTLIFYGKDFKKNDTSFIKSFAQPMALDYNDNYVNEEDNGNYEFYFNSHKENNNEQESQQNDGGNNSDEGENRNAKGKKNNNNNL